MIGTVVGSGRTGAAREGTDAHLAGVVPRDLALMPDGSLLIADAVNHRVWIVSALEGAVSTLAGTGMAGLSGDGGAAAEASLDGPTGVAVGPAGIVYIADRNNGRIRTVDPHSGRIETIAGADGSLGEPSALTIAMDGSLRITDAQGGRVLSVDARTGRVRPLVGDLLGPEGIFIDPQNTLIVAETGRHRVWAVIEKS